jgi:hypothetical protein
MYVILPVIFSQSSACLYPSSFEHFLNLALQHNSSHTQICNGVEQVRYIKWAQARHRLRGSVSYWTQTVQSLLQELSKLELGEHAWTVVVSSNQGVGNISAGIRNSCASAHLNQIQWLFTTLELNWTKQSILMIMQTQFDHIAADLYNLRKILLVRANSLGVEIKRELPKKTPFGAFELNFIIVDAFIFGVSTLDL